MWWCSTTVSQIIPPPRMAPVLADLHELFGLPAEAADLVRDHAADLDLRCRPATGIERDEYVREMLDLIRSPRIERSMDENRAAWERGWQQNLDEARAARLRAGHVEAEVLPRPSLPALAARPGGQREPPDRVRPLRARPPAALRVVPFRDPARFTRSARAAATTSGCCRSCFPRPPSSGSTGSIRP